MLDVVRANEHSDPARIFDLVFVLDGDGQVRHLEPVVHPSKPAELEAALDHAMVAPANQSAPGRPEALGVGRVEVAEAVRDIAARHAIKIVVNAAVDVQAMLAQADPDAFPQLSEWPAMGVPPAHERRLAEAAAAIVRLEPAAYFGDELTFELVDAARPLAMPFAVFMDTPDEAPGITFFRTRDEATESMNEEEPRVTSPPCQALYFVPWTELETGISEMWERRDYALEESLYPSCIELREGKPYQLDEEATSEMIFALEVLAAHFEVAAADEEYSPGLAESVEIDGRTVEVRVHATWEGVDGDDDSYGTPPDNPFGPDERFVFEITFEGVESPIWRRFTMPADCTFGDLHRAIQLLAEWERAHLFEFARGKGRKRELLAGTSSGYGDSDSPDAEETWLCEYFVDRRPRGCEYIYDFGDMHRVAVKLLRVERRELPCELLDGAGMFPPEDSGGASLYEMWAEVARDPESDPERAEWLGDWHPDRFDREGLARQFAESY